MNSKIKKTIAKFCEIEQLPLDQVKAMYELRSKAQQKIDIDNMKKVIKGKGGEKNGKI